jgi:hypothetical protein
VNAEDELNVGMHPGIPGARFSSSSRNRFFEAAGVSKKLSFPAIYDKVGLDSE